MPEEPSAPNFRRGESPTLLGWIFYGILTVFTVVTTVECVRARGLPALATTFFSVAGPFLMVWTYRLVTPRIERWQGRRVAREVARLMSRE